MADLIQFRRDSKANWESVNPVLAEGEIGYVIDRPNLHKMGNGVDAWNALPYRGFDGTIVHETGDGENVVMSQKAVSLKLAELESKSIYATNPTNGLGRKLKELYLQGLDATMEYRIDELWVFGTNPSYYRFRIYQGDNLVASFDSSSRPSGVIKISERNNSGVSGYAIINLHYPEDHYLVSEAASGILINSVVTDVDNSPSIKASLIDEKAQLNAEDIISLQEQFGEASKLTFTTGGYIKNNTEVVDMTPIANSHYAYIKIDAKEGDMFTVKSVGSLQARIYSFIDAEYNLLQVAEQNITEAYVIAPANTAYAVFNSNNTAISYVYKGWVSAQNGMRENARAIHDVKSRVSGIDRMLKAFPITLENNLVNDGLDKIPNCEVFVDDIPSADNYGEKNAIYKIDLKERKRIHVYFEYVFDKIMPYVDENYFEPVFLAFGKAIQAGFINRGNSYGGNELYKKILPVSNNSRIGISGQFLYVDEYNAFNGDVAFWLKYTGERSSADDYVICRFENRTVTFSIKSTGSVIGVVNYMANDSVQSLVDSISAINNIEVGIVNTLGRTCGELLSDVVDCEFPLSGDYTDSKGVLHYSNAKFNIPYAIDNRTHSFEIIIDLDNLTQYEAFDGYTHKTPIRDTALADSSDTSIIIGNEYITVKNLHIDYGHFGDSEIVNNEVAPFSTSIEQLISNNNPKLLIFEGHEVVDAVEGDPSLTEYDVSTDKLTSILSRLKETGYIPVTWDDVILWKKGYMKLPKRCYVMMFDDFRVTNYLDLDKRRPFSEYGIKAGLAIVSDRYGKDDTIEVDGISYTISEAISVTQTAGWYLTSHTKDHRRLIDFSSDELESLAKQDLYSCNKLGIRSEILVFPYGSYVTRLNAVLKRTPFSLGVNINHKNLYNCTAKNDYNLVRVALANNYTLDDICRSIV